MSDVMLHGILRMPPELWRDEPMQVSQRHGRYLQASDRIEADSREIERLRAALDWYAEMAKQMQRATLHGDSQYMIGMMKELALDGGKRARQGG